MCEIKQYICPCNRLARVQITHCDAVVDRHGIPQEIDVNVVQHFSWTPWEGCAALDFQPYMYGIGICARHTEMIENCSDVGFLTRFLSQIVSRAAGY
ncbi:hypothetical protein CTRI78_v004899 [Colletotrichum trifolii]|uniref:Uncharacterized protein n=1 Tax=Colletotrichum trifolii TaxID=5466 RepID=A0A4R8RFU8_COLTR|nr:hypothetical protein CTRI78_v004899 [Colletotrichum trifolii]